MMKQAWESRGGKDGDGEDRGVEDGEGTEMEVGEVCSNRFIRGQH